MDKQWFIVMGRIPFDDEDRVYFFYTTDAGEATDQFAREIYRDSELCEDERQRNIECHDAANGVYINHTISTGQEEPRYL